MGKSKIFIGSSVEGLDIAYAIQENLEHVAFVTVWDQDIFKPSNYALEDLEDVIDTFDHAIFVFSPDDDIKLRDMELKITRDNVIFELGLFIGKLSRQNCFIVTPRETNLHIATDLLGLMPLSFDAKRPDNNMNASLGPVCNKIKKSIQSVDEHYMNVRAKYDVLSGKYPSRRAMRYLDTACIFPNRNIFDQCVGYSKLFESASSIYAIGISLNAITVNWGLNELKKKVAENCKIKLLLLDPEGDFIKEREKEESLPEKTISNVTKTSIALLDSIEKKECFEYRLYDRSVSINMYIIDQKHTIVQHYIFDTRGQETPVFIVNNDDRTSGLFETYLSIFESMWEKTSIGK